MEIFLNLVWVACSLALISLWVRSGRSNRVPLGMQLLALAMVVVLLLPVISLSDDLMAMQTPAETDMGIRKAQQTDNWHPVAAPAAFGLLAEVLLALSLAGFSQILRRDSGQKPRELVLCRALDSRPPPRV